MDAWTDMHTDTCMNALASNRWFLSFSISFVYLAQSSWYIINMLEILWHSSLLYLLRYSTLSISSLSLLLSLCLSLSITSLSLLFSLCLSLSITSLSPLLPLCLSLATFSLSSLSLSLSLSSLSFLPSKVITNRLRSRLILPSGRTGIMLKLWLTKVGRDSMNSSTYEYWICRLYLFYTPVALLSPSSNWFLKRILSLLAFAFFIFLSSYFFLQWIRELFVCGRGFRAGQRNVPWSRWAHLPFSFIQDYMLSHDRIYAFKHKILRRKYTFW